MVEIHPEPGTSELTHPIFAATDDNGEFSVATYEKDDGLPEGTYSLAFTWQTFSLVKKDKKDKLNGAYSDPKKSNIKVTVVEGEPTDLGLIELSTKGPVK